MNLSKKNQLKAERIMGKKPLNPIGSCFDSAAYQFTHSPNRPKDCVICHGIGVANVPGQEGQTMAHAWLEYTFDNIRCAMDTTWGVVELASAYRRDLKLAYVVEYDYLEFLMLWARHNYPGPFDKNIKAISDGNI